LIARKRVPGVTGLNFLIAIWTYTPS